jgi:hypothetical protein
MATRHALVSTVPDGGVVSFVRPSDWNAAHTTEGGYELVIDGNGSVITTGVKADLVVLSACTIASVTLLADVSGSIVIDIWRDSYANYPPTVGDTICASARPTLSSAIKSYDATLSGWSKLCSKGDVLRFNVVSASTVTRVTVALAVVE